MFGDFDRDGIKNIDDLYPFNNKKKNYPNPNKPGQYYIKSRYGNNETLLSDVLKNIYKRNDQNSAKLNSLLHSNPGSFGRTKTVPSTIKKLYDKYYFIYLFEILCC